MALMDVVQYILQKQGDMTTMKLQKLVYYSQAWSLAWDGVALFDEDFQAWANGPVCPELYWQHKGQFVVNSSTFSTGDATVLTDTQVETIDAVLSSYGAHDSQWLSNLTHLERPWKEARGATPVGERSTVIIDKTVIQEYYSGLAVGDSEDV